MSDVLATVSASMPRRVFSIAAMVVLGGLLVYIALGRGHSSVFWQLFLLAFGVLVLVFAEWIRRSTTVRLELTSEGLRDSDGRELARIDEIRSIERGMMALKPSNGFVLRLSTAKGRVWAPGIYWRIGRNLGVGGVVSAGQTKFMAEMLAALVAERQAED